MDGAQGHPRRWSILLALCAALLMIVVDNTVLHVAVPAIGTAFGASTGQLQAVVDAYVVVFAGLLITAGVLGDRYGRRRCVIAGLVIFGVASALAAAAPSVAWLIAARAVMGVGSALVMPATLAVLVRVFAPGERARAFAVWSAVASAGMAAGPVLGGALVDAWSWAGVFVINVPVVAVALAAVVRLVPETREPGAARVDVPGAVLVTAGVAGVVAAVIEAPGGARWAPAAAVAGAAALAVFGVRQRRAAEPLVDLRLYGDRRFAGGSFAVAVMTVATGSTLFILAQYLQLVLGYGAAATGLAAVPLALGVVLGSVAGGRAPARYGARACVVTGFALTACAFALLAAAPGGYATVAAALGLAGLGSGVAGPAATSTVLGAVPPERAGMGSALNDTHQQLGIALGVAVLGSLLAAVYRGGLPAGIPGRAAGSLAATLSYAHDRPSVLAAARAAYAHAQSVTMIVAAGAAVTAAVVAFAALRTGAPASRTTR